MHNDRAAVSPAHAMNRRPPCQTVKSRPRADAEALQRKLPLPPGHLPRYYCPTQRETLAVRSVQTTSRRFGGATQGAGRRRVEQTTEIPATTCRRPSIGLYRRQFSQKQNPTFKPTLSGCMASAEWISEWHRMAANQEPIYCPKAPSSPARATLCFRRVARLAAPR